MGVYIKGMKMPKNCEECVIEGHYENSYGDEYGFFCPFGYKAYTRGIKDSGRLDDCPLVPIPPHGDLIDRKAAYDSLLNGMVMTGYQSRALDCVAEYAVSTIIPADKDDET